MVRARVNKQKKFNSQKKSVRSSPRLRRKSGSTPARDREYTPIDIMPVGAYIQLVGRLLGKPPKQLAWIRSSKRDLRAFPETAQKHIGFALKSAQFGEKHPDAKPLKGFGGASVLEIGEDYGGDTYRAVYTLRFREVVCVLHAFQKKSRSGSATPRHHIDLIKERLRYAKELHDRKLL